jgi:hypothetical protein
MSEEQKVAYIEAAISLIGYLPANEQEDRARQLLDKILGMF